MRLELASINFKNSTIEDREKLAFSQEEIIDILNKLKKKRSVSGCVILATCNRTEIYMSRTKINLAEEIEDSLKKEYEATCDQLLLEALGITNLQVAFEHKRDEDVAFYLTELASGLKSQILGEGQIVTQIGSAWQLAKGQECTDSVLNVLFQGAVAAGKKVLTKVKISNVPLSSAYAAFDLIRNNFDTLKGKKALLVGNGNMSRLMQELLTETGCDVFVTIRGYTHGNNQVVEGCKKIAYADRYQYMEQADFVVSATRSPHRTIKLERLVAEVTNIPSLMVDLAMPRDIDEAVNTVCTLKNINELGFQTEVDEDTLSRVYAIIEESVAEFYHWYSYENALDEIELLKGAMKRRILGNFRQENLCIEQEERVVELAVDKSVKMLLGGMHEHVNADIIRECRKKIEMRTRE